MACSHLHHERAIPSVCERKPTNIRRFKLASQSFQLRRRQAERWMPGDICGKREADFSHACSRELLSTTFTVLDKVKTDHEDEKRKAERPRH